MIPGAGFEDEHTTASDLAAHALLGALLWDSRRAHDVHWLQAQDFARPVHGSVYATITGMLADELAVDPHSILEPLISARYHDSPTAFRENPGGLIHSMIAETPSTPPGVGVASRSEHVRYAQMILDDSIRRQVTAAGVRVGQQIQHATLVDHEAAAERTDIVVTDAVGRLEGLLDRLQASTNWSALNPPRLVTQPAGDPDPGGVHLGELDPAEVLRAEQRLIGICLTDPSARDEALAQLLPQDFSDRATAETWEALGDLVSMGTTPVDYVFLARELEDRSQSPDGPLYRHPASVDPALALPDNPESSRDVGLSPVQLRLAVRGATAAAVYPELDLIARSALARIGQTTTAAMIEMSGDRSRTARDAVTDAQRVLERAGTEARRLGGAPTSAHTTAAALFVVPTQTGRPRAATAPRRPALPPSGPHGPSSQHPAPHR